MPPSIAKLCETAIARFKRFRIVLGRIGLHKIPQAIIVRYSRNGPKSLSNRVLLLQFVWAICIYMLVIAALWFATNLIIENSVRHQGEGWIAKLDQLGIPLYATDNPAQLKKSISFLRDFPEVARAKYLNETGKKIIAEYTRKSGLIDDFAPLSDDLMKKLGRVDVDQKNSIFEKSGHSQMRIITPIWVKSIANDGMIDYSLSKKSGEKAETIGFIEIVLDYSKITSDLNRNIFYASMLIAVMMLVAAFVARIMIRWALMPLSELEEPLTRLANGETDVTVNTNGDKEIARIGIALNTTIGALKERDEALRRLAVHDTLTGLTNRAYFVERLEQEVSRVVRAGGRGSSALLFFDLDRFKNINDTYGHAAGDRLLIQVAKLLSQRIRGNDLFARYGGDEFTLLAYDVNRNNIQEVADSFIALMRDYVFYEAGDIIKIYFSIGITFIDSGILSTQEYLKEADVAVHQAKMLGRNGFSIFARKTHGITGESGVGWHQRLLDVLRNEQTILYYQPLYGLKVRQENLYEVLLRLPDMEQEVISPVAFMSAAERFGLMADFDRQVINKAALVLAGLKDPQAVLSVNCSEQLFAADDIPGLIDEIVGTHHIEPKQFIFELSQSYIVRNIDRLQAILTVLAQRGYRFAIDDFGADFGTFNYIKKLPVHFLKIDGALIEHIAVDKIAKKTVHAIVEVSAELNIQTIAKNVGDATSITLLRELGVDYAQGNHIAAPSPELCKVASVTDLTHVKFSN